METIIEVENLRKNYGDIRAVADISFYVEKGTLFSFLGPNGAGKSTTIDILCTLLQKDAGAIRINGMDLEKNVAAVRRQIGVVFQDHVLDNLLSVRENLDIRAGFYFKNGAQRRAAIARAAAVTGVMDCIDRPYGKLSGGQKRRADITRALLHTPQILFLDEPTTGLDPQNRKHIWETIARLQRETGMTIFLTTHYMEEAAASDYVVVIDHGKIVAKGAPAQLKEQYARDLLRLDVREEAGLARALAQRGTPYEKGAAGEWLVKLGDTMEAMPLLELCKPYISGFEVLRGTMDDAFIGITGKELRE